LHHYRYDVCDGVDATSTGEGGCGGEGGDAVTQFNVGAVALFILSQLMLGVAMSPTSSLTLTFMDDNARDQAPKHFVK